MRRRNLLMSNGGGNPYAKQYLTFNIGNGGGYVKHTVSGTNLQYSKDSGTTWTSLAYNTNLRVTANSKVMFKGVNNGTSSSSPRVQFSASTASSFSFSIEGNVESVIYGDAFKNRTSADTIVQKAYFKMFAFCNRLTSAKNLVIPDVQMNYATCEQMFLGCTSLTTAPELPSTRLGNNCYTEMFEACSSLTTAPELPATHLSTGCYWSMFYNCSSLTTAPNLPATTLASSCYMTMFHRCLSLTTAPELPATTLASQCYRSMFYECTSLTTAPNLPATTLASNCYSGMFQGCTSLTTAPELPATTLEYGCYYFMFFETNVLPDCTNIDFSSSDVVASGGLMGLFAGTPLTDSDLDNILRSHGIYDYSLPCTTLATSCYQEMFARCTSLTTAPELPATTLAQYCYYMMFSECTSLTTVPSVLPATTLDEYCYQSMFYGCSGITSVPSDLLPATHLSTGCYGGMFSECRYLTTTPELLSTTLVDYCYNTMFYHCYDISSIICLAEDISATDCTTSWVDGAGSSGTFYKSANMNDWTRDVNGIPQGWAIEDY